MLFNEKIKRLYKDYAGKVCFITGSKGFIGTHLKNRLTELGAFVYGYDIQLGRDICNKDYLTDFIEGIPAKIDYVFHLAALTEVVDSYSRPREYYETNVLGTLNILEEVRQRKINSLVVASTDKVYGTVQRFNGYEEIDSLEHSLDPYGNTKRCADLICQDYKQIFNLPLKILRSVNTYGPGQRNTTTLITNTINLLLSGSQPVSYKDALTKCREWLYIDDAIQAYLMAGLMNTTLKNYNNYGYIYNIGSGEIHKAFVIINKIMEQMNIKKSINILEDSKRSTHHQFVNSSLFTNMMKRIDSSWEPTKIDEGLEKTIAWHVTNSKENNGHNTSI